jgi:hypothetical protein
MNEWILMTHAGATLFLAGLIWFVQIVHYPLFARVGAEAFVGYEREHQARTSLVVGPMMLLEAVTAATILVRAEGGETFALAVIGALLLVGVWISTAFVQVPLHRTLQEGFDARAARLLVRTNWLRTAAWSARSGIALALL